MDGRGPSSATGDACGSCLLALDGALRSGAALIVTAGPTAASLALTIACSGPCPSSSDTRQTKTVEQPSLLRYKPVQIILEVGGACPTAAGHAPKTTVAVERIGLEPSKLVEDLLDAPVQ